MSFFYLFFRKNKNKAKNDTPLPNLNKLDEMINQEINTTKYTEKANGKSKLHLEKHLENIGKIDFSTTKSYSNVLTPEELSFLMYIDNKTLNSIAGYWTHEVNLNIKSTIEKFLYLKLISYAPTSSSFGINELKNLLNTKNLSTKGIKQELVNRILQNFDSDYLISKNFICKFKLTVSGKNVLKDIPKSITHNYIRDKHILSLISKEQFIEAYKEVCKYEISKPLPRGLHINWSKELIYCTCFDSSVYEDIFQTNYLNDYDLNLRYKSLLVYYAMLGRSSSTLTKQILSDWVSKDFDKFKLIKTSNINKLNKKRNLTGFEYEKIGDIDNAIICYEKSLSEKFEGNGPYDRLSIIYRKRKDYENELRVLNHAITVFENLKLTSQRQDIEKKLENFRKRRLKVISLIK